MQVQSVSIHAMLTYNRTQNAFTSIIFITGFLLRSRWLSQLSTKYAQDLCFVFLSIAAQLHPSCIGFQCIALPCIAIVFRMLSRPFLLRWFCCLTPRRKSIREVNFFLLFSLFVPFCLFFTLFFAISLSPFNFFFLYSFDCYFNITLIN